MFWESSEFDDDRGARDDRHGTRSTRSLRGRPPRWDGDLSGVTKSFGEFTAVRDLDLEVASGEFLSMLGPSGSGKTTVLRMIAGFEDTTSGSIRLSGVDVTRTPPHARPVNTVFQDYALFPHLTIADNVGYGLRVRGEGKSARAARVQTSLEQVRLDHVADRLPHQLSGGQRQRIALARALILRPQVLLLDEPLGALDKQLREQMQIELKQIQREVGITFIFVTTTRRRPSRSATASRCSTAAGSSRSAPHAMCTSARRPSSSHASSGSRTSSAESWPRA